MPPVIHIFSLCAFAVGFTEFITIGPVSAMADDLQVDVTRIGLTVTIYAAGVVISAGIGAAIAVVAVVALLWQIALPSMKAAGRSATPAADRERTCGGGPSTPTSVMTQNTKYPTVLAVDTPPHCG